MATLSQLIKFAFSEFKDDNQILLDNSDFRIHELELLMEYAAPKVQLNHFIEKIPSEFLDGYSTQIILNIGDLIHYLDKQSSYEL